MQANAQQNHPVFIAHKSYRRLLLACSLMISMVALGAWLFSSAWIERDYLNLVAICIGSVIIIVSGADYFYKLERLLKHQFALQADQEGLHHFLCPKIQWGEIAGIEFVQETFNGRLEKFLCVKLVRSAQPNIKEIKWWRMSEADVHLHKLRHAVLIPCAELKGDPRLIAFSIDRVKQNTALLHI
jgi:hypothetical protein